MQITHSEATKQHGVAALQEIEGSSALHTLAIGDGTNDLALFRSAHLKIAMGNATEELKAAADYIVGTINEDGFAEAMRRFVLN